MKKKVLFVINTMGQAGAEKALLTLLRAMDPMEYDIDLYVMLNQGELISDVPEYVHLLNRHFSKSSVLSRGGKRHLILEVLKSGLRHGAFFSTFFYMVSNLWRMMEQSRIQPDKLLWRMVAKGGKRFKTEYDVAIAYLEGASTYYVADYVNARKKAAWVHVDMDLAGYNEYLDTDCYDKINHIFAVSEEVRDAFVEVHPECVEKTDVFYNLIDQDSIRRLAKEGTPEGFDEKVLRLLTVGRLHSQKAYDVAIQAMAYLRKWRYPIKWYVIGDGPLKKSLQELINQKKLTDYFILLGAKKNPYPYYANCDIYVHATRFEGKSVAIQEAQTLGCAVIVSDVSGNREQVVNGYDGVICDLNGKKLAEAIVNLAEDPYVRKRMGNRNLEKDLGYSKKSIDQLFAQIEQ